MERRHLYGLQLILDESKRPLLDPLRLELACVLHRAILLVRQDEAGRTRELVRIKMETN
jgi:hypothetical protein